MKSRPALVSLVILVLSACNPTNARELSALRLLYVGDKASPRESQVTDFLRGHVASVDVTDRHGFDPSTAAPYDVVLLEWPQSAETREMRLLTSPLGPREKWGKPTVLLGSAGLNLAVAWKARGGAGCTCMDPLAYGLRDHEIFDAPFKIDRSQTVTVPTPPDFKAEIKDPTIEVVPLVDDLKRSWRPGWCTYVNGFSENPDIEYFGGGVNHKTPTAAGLWRQGNLLHFGFEQSPAEMNQTGQHLLLNSIAYISRFSQDRPIAVTPSVFAGKVAPARVSIVRRLRDPEYKLEWIAETISEQLWKQLAGNTRDQMVAWAEASAQYLYPVADARLDLDTDLAALKVTFDESEFLDVIVRLARSGTPEDRIVGKRLVDRYLPGVSTTAATPDALEEWINQNRPYLFASDVGDYRWYVDELAKRRGIPSAELRGPKRADIATVSKAE